ncbi:hypothetical protein [Levilactobacillus sp. HBUAS70063]
MLDHSRIVFIKYLCFPATPVLTAAYRSRQMGWNAVGERQGVQPTLRQR